MVSGEIPAGRVTMTYSDSGTSVGKAWAMPVREVLEECAAALRSLNPRAYPRKSNVMRYDYRNQETAK